MKTSSFVPPVGFVAIAGVSTSGRDDDDNGGTAGTGGSSPAEGPAGEAELGGGRRPWPARPERPEQLGWRVTGTAGTYRNRGHDWNLPEPREPQERPEPQALVAPRWNGRHGGERAARRERAARPGLAAWRARAAWAARVEQLGPAERRPRPVHGGRRGRQRAAQLQMAGAAGTGGPQPGPAEQPGRAAQAAAAGTGWRRQAPAGDRRRGRRTR